MLKKTAFALCAIGLAFSLVACSGPETEADEEPVEPGIEEDFQEEEEFMEEPADEDFEAVEEDDYGEAADEPAGDEDGGEYADEDHAEEEHAEEEHAEEDDEYAGDDQEDGDY